ncbi:hypothetical protein EK904_002069 [Melospiza melodia maxima]|nr:hypothetical protein EK904_002069 [Melospiza melodia maxima]
MGRRAAMEIPISQHPHLAARAGPGRCSAVARSHQHRAPGRSALPSPRREAESGYHRVLARYRPEEPPGQEVAAGSLVFVLGRAADGWATAIHDGQKISTGIPLPPAQVPPSRLPMKQKPDPAGEENASVNDASAHMDSKVRPAVLRLRCECSLVLRAGEAPALPALRALLRDRLAQQAQRGALRYGAVGWDGPAAIPLRTRASSCLWAPGNVYLGPKAAKM